MIGEVMRAYPNLKAVATTLRTARSASVERLGRHRLRRRPVLRGRRSATSRSSTASAAATRSPRGSSTASSPARTRSGRSAAASPTARWPCRRPATPRWPRSPRCCAPWRRRARGSTDDPRRARRSRAATPKSSGASKPWRSSRSSAPPRPIWRCAPRAAVLAGGISVFEITMTVPDAPAVIRALVTRAGRPGGGRRRHRAERGGGAPVHRRRRRVHRQPRPRPDTIAEAHARGVPAMPGALTPTEVIAAWNLGADLVKIFPVSAVGGAQYLRALRGPLPEVKLLPTGGITAANAAEYLAAGAVGPRRRLRAGRHRRPSPRGATRRHRARARAAAPPCRPRRVAGPRRERR